VLEKPGEWSVEGTVAGPKAGEREDAFSAEFLSTVSMDGSRVDEVVNSPAQDDLARR
jgi:hypothetical protein